jgi:ribosomal protein S18 acetylase RimI-like enzyme
MIAYEWRGDFSNAALSALHAEGFGPQATDHDWRAQVTQHSLGWVCGWEGRDLVGFVNVAWDGGAHAFILDTLISNRLRRHGAGTTMVALASERARAAGCAWLHVDFEDQLAPFYLGSCGFRPASAGLIAL